MVAPQGQLALDLPVRTARGREDFFVASANRAAVSVVESTETWPGPVMVLVGPAGSGKTHLSEVWRTMTGAALIDMGALCADDVPGYLKNGHLIIEDAPARDLPERALFHLINLARELDARLLITSRYSPAQWHVTLPDLASRLRAAGVAFLGAPDDALLRCVLIKQFCDRQLSVDESVINYMLARMERSMETARALVAEIDRRSMSERAAVTRPFVARVMNDGPR